MKNAYPIIMTQGKEFIVAFIPDFNINTQGKDVPDAIEMARDVAGLHPEIPGLHRLWPCGAAAL